MQADLRQEPHAWQVLTGDFNISRLTAWGEDNLKPKGQAEERVIERHQDYFDDLYLRDHHILTGKRTTGDPSYLHIDNHRLNQNMQEPSGSWYDGPFSDPGILLSTIMRYDRQKHNRPEPQKVELVTVKKSTWGRQAWHSEQIANTARYDYILLLKNQGQKAALAPLSLDGRVEIRRIVVPPGSQSASSDHLPVDGRIWLTATGKLRAP